MKRFSGPNCPRKCPTRGVVGRKKSGAKAVQTLAPLEDAPPGTRTPNLLIKSPLERDFACSTKPAKTPVPPTFSELDQFGPNPRLTASTVPGTVPA